LNFAIKMVFFALWHSEKKEAFGLSYG